MFKELVRRYVRWRTHRAHYLYLNGQITMAERDDIVTRMRILKCKWVKDQCHRFCFKCEYKNRCYEEEYFKVKGL